MPATIEGAPNNETNLGSPLIRNYTTTIKVRVFSHQTSVPVDCGDDVFEFTFSKTIKGVGKATLMLVPAKNYLNKVFPNDYINIYLNRGDQLGWVRVFFGFVDRISEQFKIDSNGIPQSSYKLHCSDFQKAFDKTDIYFNPALAGREDFQDSFGSLNLGGMALFSKGLVAKGAPPDVILQVILSLMGFGGQFQLPPGLNPNNKDKIREQNRKRVFQNAGISNVDQTADAFLKQIDVERKTRENLISEFLLTASPEDIKKRADALRIRTVNLDDKSPQNREKLIKLFADRWVVYSLFQNREDLRRQVVNALSTTRSNFPPNLLDMIDLVTFVEREAIDGFMANTAIWTQTGPLSSFIQSYSNEAINELFWDLRAVNVGDGLQRDSIFERSEDDIGGNVEGGVAGIKYVPALIMREYPFGTIGKIDARSVYLGLIDNRSGNQGLFQVGNIFNDIPNEPGRHVINVENICVTDVEVDTGSTVQGGTPSGLPKQTGSAKKHLDVAVISDAEIISMDIGRSDAEHFNIFEISSDALVGDAVKWITSDFLPIISPIDIAQHGVRVRGFSTRFDRFTQQANPNKASKPNLPLAGDGNEETAVDTTTGTPQLPVAAGSVTRQIRYAYREESGESTWQFHYGIDVFAAAGTPIVCPVDGEVVAVAPRGIFGGYGNVVVIKHADGNFSMYTHMNSIDSSLSALFPKATGVPRDGRAGGGAIGPSFPGRKGKMKQKPIKAGDPIGTVGTTTGATSNFRSSNPHLHMEVFTRYPASGQNVDQSTPITNPKPPNPVTPYSTDPNAWLLSNVGANFLGQTEDVDPQPDDDGGDVSNEPTTGAQPETEVDTINATVSAPGPTGNVVDNRSIRAQLLRWVLLQDHWYQHNKEYLSGSITIRGAPDIRVGYRLDLADRAMSFYVEGVTHSWKFPGQMTTTLSVTRGQPNNPYPSYVLPAYEGFGATPNQRKVGSRLSSYFITPNPLAVRRASVLRGKTLTSTDQTSEIGGWPTHMLGLGDSDGPLMNPIDTEDYNDKFSEESVMISGSSEQTKVNELENLVIAETEEFGGDALAAVDNIIGDTNKLGGNR